MRMGIVLAASAASRFLPVVPLGTTAIMTVAALVGVAAGRLLAASEKLAVAGQPQAPGVLRYGRAALVAAVALCLVAAAVAVA